MTSGSTPIVKDLVLVGGGHSHVIVLKRFGMRPMPGVRLTVIARDIDTPYSGMLPGLVAGHYEFDDVHIDLGPLAQFAGARLYHDEAVGVDLAGRRLRCRDRPPVSYDVLSINIGVTPMLSVPGAPEHVVAVKPISTFVERWTRLRTRGHEQTRPLRVGVVGAGAAGVELTLSIQHALGRVRDPTQATEFHLFSSAATVLPSHNRRVQTAFRRVLAERGVTVHLGERVTSADAAGLTTETGLHYELDEVVWATEAGAQAWPGDSGLAVDPRGFVRVHDTLQSISHHDVFAAGDIAAVDKHPREKAGVFAVRQGRPLEANLRRALEARSLRPFVPQRRFLSLISTGDQYAVASRGGWKLEGQWVWRWKDWIDRRFMRRFRTFPDMKTGPPRASADLSRLASPEFAEQLTSAAMRCGGCGSKVGATVLARVLSRLTPIARADVLTGLDGADDASVETIPAGTVAVRTVDAFRPMFDDPYTFGRIVANHSLGDIYAMGAEPRTALALATVPFGPEDKTQLLLEDLLGGAVATLNESGTALVGGHTKEGPELELGLAVSGVGRPDALLHKSGMRVGDCVVLTKPLGTGTLFAAHMRRRAKGSWVDAAIETMLQSNREAAACLLRHRVTACTDVTGFGFVGHLLEMARASEVDVEVDLDAIPLLTGALETARRGLLSSLQPENVRLRRAVFNHDSIRLDPRYPLLFDPQTAGGLMATVPETQAEDCLRALRSAGYERTALVGVVRPRTERDAPLRIVG